MVVSFLWLNPCIGEQSRAEQYMQKHSTHTHTHTRAPPPPRLQAMSTIKMAGPT